MQLARQEKNTVSTLQRNTSSLGLVCGTPLLHDQLSQTVPSKQIEFFNFSAPLHASMSFPAGIFRLMVSFSSSFMVWVHLVVVMVIDLSAYTAAAWNARLAAHISRSIPLNPSIVCPFSV